MGYFEDRFNKSIEEIIHKTEYPVYWISINQNVLCTCVDYDSKVPDSNCKKCLGTGNKIKIKKITASSNESDTPGTMKQKDMIMISKLYYVNIKYPIEINDMIVSGDDETAYYVNQKIPYRSFGGKKVYQKLLCPPKKINNKIFFKNFHEIVGDRNA